MSKKTTIPAVTTESLHYFAESCCCLHERTSQAKGIIESHAKSFMECGQPRLANAFLSRAYAAGEEIKRAAREARSRLAVPDDLS